jgi:hypothetical protein
LQGDRDLLSELLIGCQSVIQGKVKELDCLYLVRQVHDRRYLAPDMFDWITSPNWLQSYELFRERLSEELAQQDEITIDQAREVVKQAFWAYLARGLGKKWASLYTQNGAGPRYRVRETARRIPGLRWAWRNGWSFLPGENNKMSLPALLRPTSPYHADFMPIYRAITSTGGNLRGTGGSPGQSPGAPAGSSSTPDGFPGSTEPIHP